MRTPLALAATLTSIALSAPALAQDAADRIDPARAQERTEQRTIPTGSAAPTPLVAAPMVQGAVGPTFDVGAIDLVGLEVMPRARFADIIENYIGRTLGPAELAELADRLAARARTVYPLASASIDPQTLHAGVLRVRIDEGSIDEVRLDGIDNRAVLAALQPLATGRPVSAAELERRLLIAGDIDGVTLGKAHVEQEGDRNILRLAGSYREFRAEVTADNDSTEPSGPVETFASARFNGLLSDDDSLQLYVLNAVPDVAELVFGSARYTQRVSATGTEAFVSASYSSNAPGAYLAPFHLEGESWLATVGVQHPVVRSRRTSVWLEASLAHRELHRTERGDPVRRDRLTIARASLSGYVQMAGGRLSASASLAQGIAVLGATERGDPLASRNDADATYTAAILSADWSRKIAGPLGLRLAVRTQLSSQALLLSEEIGLGGASFGRGYDYSERSGDEGTMAYGELHYAWDDVGPLNGLEIYTFADGGEVTNLAGGFGGGTLFSSGGGLRADVDRHTDAAFEVAVPLSGPRYDDDSEDPRIRLSVTRYF